MMGQEQKYEIPFPIGIDQSEQPAPNSVYDMCNLSTHNGKLELAAGIDTIHSSSLSTPFCYIADYLHDNNLEKSERDCLVVFVQMTDGLDVSFVFAGDVGGEATLPISCFVDGYKIHSSRQKLMKYARGDSEGSYGYTTGLILADGVHGLFCVRQQSNSVVPVIENLQMLDGGDGSLTYLKDPPIGKYLEVHKERLFLGNCAGAGNRLIWTTSDSGLAFIANCWPAAYNLDVGGNEPITGLKSIGEQLLVFKENSIYSITGDGVSGNWTVTLIEKGVGAFNQDCIVEYQGTIYFTNRNGIYQFTGGASRCISHPFLQDTWKRLDTSEYSHLGADFCAFKNNHMLIDYERNLLFFFAGFSNNLNDVAFVYDFSRQVWSRWGSVNEELRALHSVPVPERLLVSNTDCYKGQLIGLIGGAGRAGNSKAQIITYIHGYRNIDCYRRSYSGLDNNSYGIPWFVLTNDLAKSRNVKTARNIYVGLKKSGKAYLAAAVCRDGESVQDATRKDISKFNLISDAAVAAEHSVIGTSQFQTVADGPVDLWLSIVPTYKLADSLALVASSGSTKIKFAAALDSTLYDNNLVVFQEDKAKVYSVSLLKTAKAIWGDSTYKLGSCYFWKNECEDVIIPINSVGKFFRLFLTNMNERYVDISIFPNYCVYGVPWEIDSLALGFIERDTTR